MAINRNKVLNKAQKFVQQGKLQKAVDEYLVLVSDDPSDVRTLLKVGDLYSKMGNVEAALDTYKDVANHYSRDGFFLKAVAVYKQMLKLDPSSISIYTKLADLYNQLGLNSEAMKQYQIVAKHYETKGMKKESLDIFKKMAELDPNNLASRVKLAELYAREGETKQAIDDFLKIAAELKERGNKEDLIKIYEKIIKIDQGNLKMVRDLATLYLEISEPKRALAKLQVCFKKNPKDEATLSLLAQAFNELQQPEKARAVYTELLAVYTEKGDQERAAKVQAKLSGETNLAEKDSFVSASSFTLPTPAPPPPEPATVDVPPPATENTAAAEETDLEKLMADVEVYMRYGLTDKAIVALKNVLLGDPALPDIRQKLTEIFVSNGDNKGAIKALFEIIEVANKRSDTATETAVLGEIVSIDSKNEQALKRLEELEVPVPALTAETSDVSAVEESGEVVELSAEEVVEEAVEAVEEIGDEIVDEEVSSSEPLAEVVEAEATAFEEAEVVEEEPISIEIEAEPPIEVEAIDALEDEMLREPNVEEEAAALKSQIEFKSPDDVSNPEFKQVEAEPLEEPALEMQDIAAEDINIEPEISIDAPLEASPTAELSESEPNIEVPAIDLSGEDFDDVEVPEPPPATLDTAGEKFASEMEEANFFYEQGLTEEVQSILGDILNQDPDFAPAKELAAKLGIASTGESVEPQAVADIVDTSASPEPEIDVATPIESPPAIEATAEPPAVQQDLGGDDLFDLADALKDDIEAIEQETSSTEEAGGPEYATFDDVLSAFKLGVQKTVGEDESQAHYDLGIAYKEMGLLQEAISAFQLSVRDEQLATESYSLMGLCYKELKRFSEAEVSFQKAIEVLPEDDDRRLALQYDLAETYMEGGRLKPALETFKEIYEKNNSFREVSHHMKALAEQLEGVVDDEVEEVAAQKKKNKISYL